MATSNAPTLILSGARAALAAAEAHANRIGVPMNIAIVDSHCHLLTFTRMDGAKVTSINIAIDKAFTAAGHRVPTSSYKENVWPGGVAFGIWNTNGGRFCPIGGGVPIISEDGHVLGAIGCSTGTPMQDEEVASAGRDAVLAMIKEKVAVQTRKEEERQTKRARSDVKPVESVIFEGVILDQAKL
ncbi:DUF336-domain-containing protein [Zopfia rhizophila CBS 207.26]|uniref:DUF336-domain-containing protein n=1 Tax=Zopfia rhizophila CBS 207.26 TaxID=1314779 RepID=A0A6A6DT92_9PEZI|nr:DUF336-domain-containing protein [Zopfia rhizophila CBS 207.26]